MFYPYLFQTWIRTTAFVKSKRAYASESVNCGRAGSARFDNDDKIWYNQNDAGDAALGVPKCKQGVLRMPRFFTNEIDEENIILTGSDAKHIGRSLRMKKGEAVTVCCNGTDYNCTINSITEDSVYLDLIEKKLCAAEPNVNVTLYQAVPKMDKLEYIIQKSVELGVSRIVPILTRRCISRPDSKDFTKKLARLNKISEEAAKQSGRGIIPEVTPMLTWKNAVEEMSKEDLTVILYEEQGGCSFGAVDFEGKKNIGLVIGSEGGFDREEVNTVLENGAVQVWLGKRILRCETAPITAASILMFLTNNM